MASLRETLEETEERIECRRLNINRLARHGVRGDVIASLERDLDSLVSQRDALVRQIAREG